MRAIKNSKINEYEYTRKTKDVSSEKIHLLEEVIVNVAAIRKSLLREIYNKIIRPPTSEKDDTLSKLERHSKIRVLISH